MFQKKISELKNNNIFQKVTNFILNSKYLQSIWVFLFVFSLYIFDFNFLVTFMMFLLSTQILFNYETMTDKSKLKNLLNLLKLWLFTSFVLLGNYIFESLVGYKLIVKIIQIVLIYSFINTSHKWFRENNMLFGNFNTAYKSDGSINIVDKVLNITFGLYANNYLLLHYMLLFSCFISEKLTLFTSRNNICIGSVDISNEIIDSVEINNMDNYNLEDKESEEDILDTILDQTLDESLKEKPDEVIKNFYNNYNKNILDESNIDLLDEDI